MKRATRRAMTHAHGAIGKYWQQRILPKHFTAAARHTYHHKPRKPGTVARKRRRGRYIDNVDSGLAQSIALSSHPVRAFPTRATVRIPGPKYFTMRRKNPNAVHPVSEILTVIDPEREAMTKIGGEKFEAELKREKARKTKRFG